MRPNRTPARDVQVLMFRTYEYATFHGRRDFADMIKILEMETRRVLKGRREVKKVMSEAELGAIPLPEWGLEPMNMDSL